MADRERVVDLAVPAAVLDATLRLGRADVQLQFDAPESAGSAAGADPRGQ